MLLATESGVYKEGTITIHQLDIQKDNKLYLLEPKRLIAIQQCINASYSSCKSTKECPYIIISDLDLYKVT